MLTVYTVIQIYIALVRQTRVSVILYKALNFDWFSKKTQLWNRVICFRVICFWFHWYFGCQKYQFNLITSSTTLFKRDLSTFLRFTGLSTSFSASSSWIICSKLYKIINFSCPPPTPNPHFSFFPAKTSDWPPQKWFLHLLCPLIFTGFLITLLVDLVQCQHFSSSSCLIAPVGT